MINYFINKIIKMSREKAISNWKRLAGKAYIRYGEFEHPDPYEPTHVYTY